MKRTLRQIVNLIKKHKPTEPEAFAAIGVTLEKKALGAGIFRECVRVKGYPLAVKFPLHDEVEDGLPSAQEGIDHSRDEVKKITGLQTSWLKKFLPKIYYHDKKHGIVVVHWYKDFGTERDKFRALGKLVSYAVNRSTGAKITDIHEENIRQGKTRHDVILIDLGY